MKQISQSTVQPQHISTAQGKKIKNHPRLIPNRPPHPTFSYLHSSVCSRLHVPVGLNWGFTPLKKKNLKIINPQKIAFSNYRTTGGGMEHLLKVKMQFPAVYLWKEKNPLPPNLILNMGQVLILCWKALESTPLVSHKSQEPELTATA